MAFITFEGIDGCGKSTQIKKLHENLMKEGFPVIVTREPGGTPISEKIRELLLNKENREMSHRCELLLYLAARAQHVEEKILPHLDKGTIVLSDRFEEATYVYQGAGRGLKFDIVSPINSFATGGLIPDRTFILDIPVAESERRFAMSGKIRDRLELNDKDFFNKIRAGYLERALKNPYRITILDGKLPIDVLGYQIFNETMRVIKDQR